MDNYTWNRLSTGDVLKGPNGLILEVIRVDQYTRSKPTGMLCMNLLAANHYRISKLHIEQYTQIKSDDPSYRAAKILFGKNQF